MEDIYYIVHKWMTARLGLCRDEKDVYAVIYGVTREGQAEYFGGMDFIAEVLGISSSAVFRAVRGLVRRGLVSRQRTTLRGCVVSTVYQINRGHLAFLAAGGTSGGTTGESESAKRDKYNNNNKNLSAHAREQLREFHIPLDAEIAAGQDIDALVAALRQSAWLRDVAAKRGLRWLLGRYSRVINGEYADAAAPTRTAPRVKEFTLSNGKVTTNPFVVLMEKYKENIE